MKLFHACNNNLENIYIYVNRLVINESKNNRTYDIKSAYKLNLEWKAKRKGCYTLFNSSLHQQQEF